MDYFQWIIFNGLFSMDYLLGYFKWIISNGKRIFLIYIAFMILFKIRKKTGPSGVWDQLRRFC